ncbi:MAG: deoxyribodipyrimidine photolyase [Rhodobacteraceae bacterium]|nr:deoxyribodipyrimidine photolyase [Paracoccaceae bacterium]MAY47057.1 deoxyribodipyrimidine photolyase [Paracoccaceae bacterium]
MPMSPILVWFRRDLRLSDHAALTAACKAGRPVIPVFICDETVEAMGAAPTWRLGLSVAALAKALEAAGSRLILRRGRALDVLRALVAETGAGAVHWTRAYDPDAIARDTDVKAALKEDGIDATSFPGHVLFEPWTVETGQGGYYKVYSPFWKTVHTRDVADLLPAPTLPVPDDWPQSDRLDDWDLGAAMNRGAGVVADFVTVGEAAAQDRLDTFIDEKLQGYDTGRDIPSADVTSRLSENLAWGEISPARLWHAGIRAREEGERGAEKFLKEVVWRDFAYHLVYHTPRITTANWREEWDGFPWKTDQRLREVRAWKTGRTGIPFVDAAMREMYVTGTMHNRARMIVASYLTKHLMVHWKVGLDWFADCLIDWDPASNAMGWQWTAGSGPDAAPYFRVFNPVSQREKFDPDRRYVDAWIAEGRKRASETACRYFDAVPRRWGLSAGDDYPDPVVTAEAGRKAALAAYENRGF